MTLVEHGSEAAPNTPSTAAKDQVKILDQVLWQDLLVAETPAAFGAAWLALACRIIPGASAGLLLLGNRNAGAAPEFAAAYPEQKIADPGLLAVAQLALKEGRGLVQPSPTGAAQKVLRAAYVITVDGALSGVAAVEVVQAPAQDTREIMRMLQWSAAWVRDFLRRGEVAAERARSSRTKVALELVAAALEEETALAACRAAATELALKLGCERVSFGFLRHGHIHIAGISHSAQFGKRMNLVRLLAEAMEEAIDQRAIVLCPPPETDAHLLVRAHEVLAKQHGAGFVLTVPMYVKDRFVGAVTFERAVGRPFEQQTIDIADAVASILGPALFDKRLNDRLLVVKCFDSLVVQAHRLLGPSHFARKLVAVATAVIIVFFYLARGEYRVSASGQVEGEVRRSIGAPFDGFVDEAPKRAGDVVKKGDVLATLDTRDLTLDRLRWATERQQHLTEYDQALSKGERADALKYQSQLGEAEAQIKLKDEEIARARLVAPFDGLVVSGDLTQSIGAAVRRGDVLFEIAPLKDYRVELRVSESQIADVSIGQSGELVVAALPDEVFPFAVERITPVATVRDGSTSFTVDGRLTSSSERLRPGMEGVGKIEVGQHRLIWIWTRSLLYWARVAVWKWLP